MGLLPVEVLVERLTEAGFPEPDEEAAILVASAGGDAGRLLSSIERRLTGEPLEWITGTTSLLGVELSIEPGVYVPRHQTAILARRAAQVLPERGTAADVATGCGPVAAVLARRRPRARVVATELDPVACRCARANGVEVYEGHLADPLPGNLWGRIDLVTAVVPYVPTSEMRYLPRDVLAHEPLLALDGGEGGLQVLTALVRVAPTLLRPGGSLLLELGGGQDVALGPVAADSGFGPARRLIDDDGDLRGVEYRLSGG